MPNFKTFRNIFYGSIIATLLIGCSKTPPDDDVISTAIMDNSKISNLYNADLIEVKNLEITNEWIEDSNDDAIFFYDYIIHYELTSKGAKTLDWTALGVAQQGEKGVTGQISLFKKGDAWYTNG